MDHFSSAGSNSLVTFHAAIAGYRPATMLSRFAAIAAVALIVPLGSGCSVFGGKKDAAPKPKIVGFAHANTSDGTKREPRLVGRVEVVNEEGKFVLVHCDAWMAPPAGTALKCMRGGVETGVVNVNAERRGANVTADIVTGKPERGDQAYQ